MPLTASGRKFDVCQKCFKPFTHNEHRFAKWCIDCRPETTVVPPKPPKAKPEGRIMDGSEFNIRHLEFSLAVKCDCGKEIDIIFGKHQSFEMVCPDCKKRFEPKLIVLEHKD